MRLAISFFTSIGWIGGAGIVMLCAALVLNMVWSLPVKHENAVLREDIDKIQIELRQPESNLLSDSQQLDKFISSLAPHDELNNLLNQLHEIASRHGLSLKNSDYHPSKARDSSIRQLRISIKTEGIYDDLRGFMQEISAAIPTLVIEQLSLTRQKISDVQLGATLEFTLFYSQKSVLK